MAYGDGKPLMTLGNKDQPSDTGYTTVTKTNFMKILICESNKD